MGAMGAMGSIVPPGRIVGLDVARCVALIGMISTHALVTSTPDGGTTVVQSIAGGRSAALFAVLAGVSLSLMSGRRTPLRGRAWWAAAAGLAVRAMVIAVVGLLLGSLDTTIAIILTYYGVLFALGIPFTLLGARALAALAVAWCVLAPVVSHVLRPELPRPTLASPVPGHLALPWELLSELTFTGYYPAWSWLTYLLAGMALGRADLRRPATAVRVLLVGAVLAVGSKLASAYLIDPPGVRSTLTRTLTGSHPPGLDNTLEHGLFGTTPTGSWWWLATSAPHTGTPFDLAHTTGTALAVIGLCLALSRFVPAVWAVVFGAGAMTFTLYSLHVVLRTPTFWPDDDVPTFTLHVLVVLVIGALFRLARRSGPLERVTADLSRAARHRVAGREPVRR